MNKLGTDLVIGQVVVTKDNKFFACASGNGMGFQSIGHAIYAHETDNEGIRRDSFQRIDLDIDVVRTNIYWWMQDLMRHHCNEVQSKYIIQYVFDVYTKWLEAQQTLSIPVFKDSHSKDRLFSEAINSQDYPYDTEEAQTTELPAPVFASLMSPSERLAEQTGTTEFEDHDMERELQSKCDEAELNGVDTSRIIEILTECMDVPAQRQAWARLEGDISDEKSEPEVHTHTMCVDCGEQGEITGHQACPFPGSFEASRR